MTNTHVRAAAEGMPEISRRRFLRHTAIAGAAGTVAVAQISPVEAAPMPTPDERIITAIEVIKAAYQEKFPDSRLHIALDDQNDGGFVLVTTMGSGGETGAANYIYNGNVVRREGGAA